MMNGKNKPSFFKALGCVDSNALSHLWSATEEIKQNTNSMCKNSHHLNVIWLFRFILTGDQQPPILRSHHSTRQNSWHDPHSELHSASSGSTLRSYHSVPDVYRASYNGSFHSTHSQPVYKPVSFNLAVQNLVISKSEVCFILCLHGRLIVPS